MKLDHPALRAFEPLPLQERLFVRARLASAPLDELASRVQGKRVLDVGCGHGLLCAMIAMGHPERSVVGIDPDSRKISWARASAGKLANTAFECTTVEKLAALEPSSFDTITVADVLYLLTEADAQGFLNACHALLKRGGRLLLKEAEDDGSWRAKKTLLQEKVMVRVLGRTHSSGGLGFVPREKTLAMLKHSGFAVREVVALGRFSSTPHVLFVAESV